MPDKSNSLLIFVFVCGIGCITLSAQEIESGVNLSKHTIGYAISYTYPKAASGSRNTSVQSDFNYGFGAAFEWSKHYTSGISFVMTPMIFYSNYDNTILYRNIYHHKDDILLYRNKYTYQFQEWILSLPVLYEFTMFKNVRLVAGASIDFPLATSGSTMGQEFDYFVSVNSQGGFNINPILKSEYTKDIDYRFKPHFGTTAKLLYKIHGRERQESFLSLEYWYTVTLGHPGYAHKTRFALSYIHRYIQLKEVRAKWDRYYIRKNKRKE